MSSSGSVSACAAAGSGVGFVAGYCVGGTKGAIEGMKIGGAAGVQVGMIIKKGQTNRPKSDVKVIFIKPGPTELKDVSDATIRCIEEIADTWSKIALTGYAMSFGLNGAVISMKSYTELCPDGFVQSVNCAINSMTQISLNLFVVSCLGSLAKQIRKF